MTIYWQVCGKCVHTECYCCGRIPSMSVHVSVYIMPFVAGFLICQNAVQYTSTEHIYLFTA